MVLICIAVMANDVEYLFVCLLIICISSLDGGRLPLKVLNVLNDKMNVTICLLHFDVRRKNICFLSIHSFTH